MIRSLLFLEATRNASANSVLFLEATINASANSVLGKRHELVRYVRYAGVC